MTTFADRKRTILASLAQPDESYIDASPKGSIDEGIRELVDEINRLDGFVTTSSCAGRIAVYQEGSAQSVEELGAASEGVPTSAGGKGGGQWLYVSHDPVALNDLEGAGDVLSLFSLSHRTQENASSTSHGAYVHLKFEPMILHVLCSSLDNARKLLGAALSSGFRESGISSISNDHDMVLVAIRTNGLAFDSIIATADSSSDKRPVILVTEQYLRMLIDVGNQRFEVNQLRKDRFRTAFFRAVDSTPSGHKHDNWEPAEVRRARKQAEGLAKRRELERSNDATSTKDSQQNSTNTEDGLDYPLILD